MKETFVFHNPEWDAILAPLGFKKVALSTNCWYHDDLLGYTNFDLSASDKPQRIIKMLFERGMDHGIREHQRKLKELLDINENI